MRTTFLKILTLLSMLCFAGVSFSGPNPPPNGDSKAKQLARDVAALKIGDVGLVQNQDYFCSYPNFCGMKFLSVPAQGKTTDILYCHIENNKKLQVVAKVDEDVVASVLWATPKDCPQVLMTKIEFIALKSNNTQEERRLSTQQENINAMLARVKAARAALDLMQK